MSAKRDLHDIFDADRTLRRAEKSLLKTGRSALTRLLEDEVAEAAELSDRREASMRLERLADLCAQVPGPEMADALMAILNDDDEAVRVTAGEALRDVGFERYAEVAKAVERAIDKGTQKTALGEVPFILAELGEPSAVVLMQQMIEAGDPEIIASVIEACVELRDPEALPLLADLRDDPREVMLPGFEDTRAPLSELAKEAYELLGGE